MEKFLQFFLLIGLKLKVPPYLKAICCKPWMVKGTHSVSTVSSQQLSLIKAARPAPGTHGSALLPAKRTSRFVPVRATSGLKCFEIEHGVCQFCHQNAQELYLNVRDAPKSQRKKLLESSWMSHLPLGQVIILFFGCFLLICVFP